MKTRTAARRPRPPLDHKRLEELAVRYVGRYSTTRSKLRSYLARKIRERGWDDAREADLEAVAERFAELGYIDDAGYALSKAEGLSSRGYGKHRLTSQLRLAGVAEEDGRAALGHADEEAVATALRFAQRRRLGPYAATAADPRTREKAIAAMVRAGHGFALARAIAGMSPGAPVDPEELGERAGCRPI